MSYIDRLIQNCRNAQSAKPEKEVVLSSLTQLDRESIDQLSSIRSAIYVITQADGDPKATLEQLKAYKGKKERACPKINSPSKVMYVGSSTTGVKKRLEQHIGDGHKDTYALHLKHWFHGSYIITVKEYDVSREVLQIIEDDLSDRLQPAFGKKGGNSK